MCRSSLTGDWAAGHEGYPPPDCSGQGEGQSILALSWASRAVAAAPSFQTCFACVHMYILYACVYICVCVYVCGHDIYLCVYTHVYVYVYAYLCIDCGSWYQCFSVWTVSCMRMFFRVHMHAYMYVCRYIYMCIFLQ